MELSVLEGAEAGTAVGCERVGDVAGKTTVDEVWFGRFCEPIGRTGRGIRDR